MKYAISMDYYDGSVVRVSNLLDSKEEAEALRDKLNDIEGEPRYYMVEVPELRIDHRG